ncbi:MAG: sugar ABC transporter permease [Caldilineaceae bacterium]
MAGLQDIPSHLYEAAELDGASQWRQMINITVPLMTPTIFFNLIINIIQGFQVFAQVLVMTGGSGGAGGPLNSTRVYVLHLFELAFNQFKMGYASALAWILFIIVLLLTLVMVKTSDRWVFYNSVNREGFAAIHEPGFSEKPGSSPQRLEPDFLVQRDADAVRNGPTRRE